MRRAMFILISAGLLCGSAAAQVNEGRADDNRAGEDRAGEDGNWSEVYASLVARLDHADWRVREQAEVELSDLGDLPYRAIEDELLGDGLSPERRARLERVAAAAYRREPLGGLGVQFGGPVNGGVAIQRVIDNGRFPAAGVLQDGDVFTHVAGKPLVRRGDRLADGQERLRAEILSRAPGETLPVSVIRDDQQLDLDVPLGSYSDLDGARVPSAQVMLPAVRLRLLRLRGEALPVVRVDADAWGEAVFGGRDALALVEELRARGGGTGGPVNAVSIGGVAPGPRGRAMHGGWSVRSAIVSGFTGDRAQAYATLAGERDRLERRLSTYESMLAGPGVDEGDRERLLESTALLRGRINELEDEIDTLVTGVD
ncbi:MAG: PDZ domain-containing protein [Planctomycetota bacterium]